MTVSVRHAEPGDLDAVVYLLRRFEAYLVGIAPGPATAMAAERLARIADLAFGPEPVCRVLLAEADGRVAGQLAYHWGVWYDDMAPALFVVDLVVDEDLRGRGVGTALMGEARRLAEARGCARMVWTVWRENRRAMAFYEKLGAVEVEEERLMALMLR